MVSLSQTIYANSLRNLLPSHVPSLHNLKSLTAAGFSAKHLRQTVPAEELEGLLTVYSIALDRIFYLCASVAVVGWAFSWKMGWTDVREKKTKSNGQMAVSSEDV